MSRLDLVTRHLNTPYCGTEICSQDADGVGLETFSGSGFTTVHSADRTQQIMLQWSVLGAVKTAEAIVAAFGETP